jgi:hypothetical protein
VVEFGSRAILPIQAGIHVETLDGQPLTRAAIFGQTHLQPDVVFRMQAAEYDVTVTHNHLGYRGRDAVADPEVLFIGDSFTYGFGLNDGDTIPAQYCAATGQRCANLGYSGSGTLQQMQILRYFLDTYGWHPKEVRLLVMASAEAMVSGGDFTDNLTFSRQSALSQKTQAEAQVIRPWSSRLKEVVLQQSNLARILVYVAGGQIRRWIQPERHGRELKQAIIVTEQALNDFAQLAAERGFACKIYLVSPLAELVSGASERTFNLLQQITPATCSLDSVNPPLLAGGHPEQYFYAIDGHYNRLGASAVAHYLVGLSGR